jgi:predicted amidohydrolase YtcJ
MSPIMGIYAAVTRRTLDGKHPHGWVPEQKITVAEAVRAYTIGSAYASFDEKLKGSIEKGKLADFVVLTDDIFAIDPVKIADTKVWLTVFDGKVIEGPSPSGYNRLPGGLLLRP